MLNRFTAAFVKVVSLSMMFLVFTSHTNAQTTIGRQKVDQFPCTAWGMLTYGLTWLPTDYSWNTSQKYPLIIFLHGKGETGDGISGLNALVTTALPMYIANGWDPVAVNPADGQSYKFIVVSPQAPVASQWSYTWSNIQYILQDVVSRYRVDPSRIYVTGLSAGGNGTWTCVTNGPGAAKKFAAIAPVCSASVGLDSIPKTGSQYGVKLWQICGDQDAFYSFVTSSTASYNNGYPNPTPMGTVTPLVGMGHAAGAWNTAYDPNWRSNIHGKNLYEWLLQYKRNDVNGGGGSTPANQAPAANAGADQNITLPLNQVILSGSASDPDGSIVSYNWSQVAGPSTASITSSASSTAQASGLTQGSYTFRLTATDNSGSTATDDIIVTVFSAASQNPGASVKIEAESYTNMSGIGTENTSDAGGGLNVGWQDNNDWMDYSVNLASAGTYTVNFRVASFFTGAQFQLRKSDGTVLTTVTVPNTGSFQNWQTVSAQVSLPAGQQTLRIFTSAANGGWNFNWWEIVGGSGSTSPDPGGTAPSGSTKIEAENYSSMAGIGTENTSDVGGGLNVGWQDNNDWMNYSVNLSTAGTYTVNFRVASFFGGAQFQLRKSDGTILTTITVPNTGSFQTWQTVSAQVALPAGQQTLRIFTSAANGGWNINWWEIAGASSSTTPPAQGTSTRIEAESFSNMSGIGTENTSDAGGGLNVGWQDNNDWMDYVVNASAAGSYNVNFRVASFFSGAQFELRNSSGTVLATMTVPNTGSFQTWTTISGTVNLPEGQQTLRIVTNAANGGWNINWWEISSGTASKGTEASGTVEQVFTNTSTATALQLFPNPIQDRFMLKVNNAQTGKMKVEIVDMKGAVVKQFNVSKAAAGVSQSYLSIGDLQTGQYILKVSMKDFSETKQLIKR